MTRSIPTTTPLARTQGKCMFGTSHWYGTIGPYPAVAVSWYGGAAMWLFDGQWKRDFKGKGLVDVYDHYGITDGTWS